MGRQIIYCLPVCFLLLIFPACRAETDWQGSGRETAGQEVSSQEGNTKKEDIRTERIGTDRSRESNQQGAAGDKDMKDNASELEREDFGYIKSKESQCLEDDYILPDSALRLYSWQELKNLSPEQLKIARNEIYARHGRRFKDDAIQAYFQGRTWYHGTVEPDKFDSSQLTRWNAATLAFSSALNRMPWGIPRRTVVSQFIQDMPI